MSISVSIFRSSKIRNIQIRSFNTSASKALHWATVRRQDIEKANEHIRKMEEGHKRALAELPDYKKWSNEDLIKRVTELEYSLKLKTSQHPIATSAKSFKKVRKEKAFDPSKYNTRFIALRFAYLGKRYNGFEHHVGNTTPLPTVEEKLWEALIKARLIFPKPVPGLKEGEVNWEGCDYSKCGRTDRGVSAFGQVVGLRVRSNRPLVKKPVATQEDAEMSEAQGMEPREGGVEMRSTSLRDVGRERTGENPSDIPLDDAAYDEALDFDPIHDELPYAALLNRLLPPDIRILAWCPAPPIEFSARFSCRERQYKYFFTNPAFLPPPENPSLSSPNTTTTNGVKEGWLDIEAMREAASYYVGEHDFRNFCKIDGSKQIENFHRRMFFADIIPESDTTGSLDFLNTPEFGPAPASTEKGKAPHVYSFTLHGSAFLWHQVRCMVSVLFLVGQGLEKPTIVRDLLDTEKNPSRPAYEMASDTPLVLWDCVFPRDDDPERKDELQWIYVGDERGWGDKKWGPCGVAEDIWKVWRERKIDEVLAAKLLGSVAGQGVPLHEATTDTWRKTLNSQKIFDGGDKAKLTGVYTPVMKKPLMESAEVINEKYAIRKGYAGAQDMKEKQAAMRELRRQHGEMVVDDVADE